MQDEVKDNAVENAAISALHLTCLGLSAAFLLVHGRLLYMINEVGGWPQAGAHLLLLAGLTVIEFIVFTGLLAEWKFWTTTLGSLKPVRLTAVIVGMIAWMIVVIFNGHAIMTSS